MPNKSLRQAGANVSSLNIWARGITLSKPRSSVGFFWERENKIPTPEH